MTLIDRAALIEPAAKCACDCHYRDTPDLKHGHVPEECPCRPLELRIDSVLNRALIEYGLHESTFSAGIRDSIVAVFEAAVPVIAKALFAPLRTLHRKVLHPAGSGLDYCRACGEALSYPCPTVRLLDAIEAEVSA